jgi:polysaccharide biosynthesis PFTS motif protein
MEFFYSIIYFTKKQKLRRIKKIMRGYEILNKREELDLILRIKDSISKSLKENQKYSYSNIIFGDQTHQAFLIITQYLFIRIGNLSFNSALLFYFGNNQSPLVYPLPLYWQDVLKGYNIKVSKNKSLFLWNLFIIAMGIYGFFFFLNLVFSNAISLLSKRTKLTKATSEFIYFDNLNFNNVPCNIDITKQKTIMSWYYNTKCSHLKNIILCHSVISTQDIYTPNYQIVYLKSPLIPFDNFRLFFLFFIVNIKLFIYVFFNYFRGHWWNVLLYSEAIKSSHFNFQKPCHIANEYLFHNSNWLYRPLWSYAAESRGAKVIFYFYSTNIQSFKSSSTKNINANTWNLVSWNHYLVWDEFQMKFLQQYVKIGTSIEVVGNIWFSTNFTNFEKSSEKFIAVFDVQPFRDSRYQILGSEIEYYIPKVCNLFLSDILKVANKYSIKVKLKRKRDAGNLIHSKYLNHLKYLETNYNFEILDSKTDSYSIIENASLVISMPFTSTALIARELGKPTIYYDALNQIVKDDTGSHEIRIVSSIDDLDTWILENIKNSH